MNDLSTHLAIENDSAPLAAEASPTAAGDSSGQDLAPTFTMVPIQTAASRLLIQAIGDMQEAARGIVPRLFTVPILDASPTVGSVTSGQPRDAARIPEPMPTAPPAAEPKAPSNRTGSRKPRADDQVIAALCQIHKYENGSAGNHEPAKLGEIASKAGCVRGTVSKVFRRWDFFQDYDGYVRSCKNNQIGFHLKMMNRDFAELATIDTAQVRDETDETDADNLE